MVLAKLAQVRLRHYVQPGPVVSLTDYFDVPKGEDDLRMVYNGTSCGLNDMLWSPSFWLPTLTTAAQVLSFYTFSVDLDLGEMFLNFPLDPVIRPYAGIDLTPFKRHFHTSPTLPSSPLWERWERQFMGLKPSPFNSVRYFYWAEEFVRGDPMSDHNPMQWDEVHLNLPGSLSYLSTLPYVMKWNGQVQRIAGDVVTYIDNLRATGYSLENSWQVAGQIASRFQYLGIQDAPWKRHPPLQQPGAWAGGLLHVTPMEITKLVTREKWKKGQVIIQEIHSNFLSAGTFDHKKLERHRGFLVHLSMTFTSITPFLKGIHLTLDLWRERRGSDGWKLSDKEWREMLLHDMETHEGTDEGDWVSVLENKADSPPKQVKAVPCLEGDLSALTEIFKQEQPPKVVLWVARVLLVVFGFGDASGSGFGSSLLNETGISYRVGVWNYTKADNSSNCREFTNVVEAIEEEATMGSLKDTELFFFTDNSTVEAALFHGTSSSRQLLDLVIRMRLLESKFNFVLKVSHVAGKRMISQGSDGISRGLLTEGVMGGAPMLSFVPLHLSAFERHAPIKTWVTSWAGTNVEFLSPKDWFTRGHDHDGGEIHADGFWRPKVVPGSFVWSPPPAAADVALEELRKARIKRQQSSHIFICPRIFTPQWLKQLYKVSDLVFVLPVGTIMWPDEMFEPCLIGLTFPFIRCKPWQIQGTPKMYAVARQLRHLWGSPDVDPGTFLRKFFQQYRELDRLPASVVSKMLYFE